MVLVEVFWKVISDLYRFASAIAIGTLHRIGQLDLVGSLMEIIPSNCAACVGQVQS
jgi:hypothetical protein